MLLKEEIDYALMPKVAVPIEPHRDRARAADVLGRGSLPVNHAPLSLLNGGGMAFCILSSKVEHKFRLR